MPTPIESPRVEHDLLACVVIPKDALDQDWKLMDGYIAYSAELLRISLLTITGIAALCLKLQEKDPNLAVSTMRRFGPSLLALAVCASAALLHRIIATDVMAYHIEALRLLLRNGAAYTSLDGKSRPSDKERAPGQIKGRQLRLHLSSALLILSAWGLVIGIICGAYALWTIGR